MPSASARIKVLHDDLLAHSAAKLLIVPAHAKQIADELGTLLAEVARIENELARLRGCGGHTTAASEVREVVRQIAPEIARVINLKPREKKKD